MKHRIGIQQGRLSPRSPRGLQAFPHQVWQREFELAARLGFDAIEWLYEADEVERNPLGTAEGRAEILRTIEQTGVTVRSICASYFLVHRLVGESKSAIGENLRTLFGLIEYGRELGVERILIPVLETGAVDTPPLVEQMIEALRAGGAVAEEHGLVLAVEMEIQGAAYRHLLDRVDHPAVRAYYDTGNSTAQGFDIAEDVLWVLPKLQAVHIKDRKRKAGSVPVGEGDGNFAGFFRSLGNGSFSGDFVLEHYFDSDPEASAKRGLAFVREGLSRAEAA